LSGGGISALMGVPLREARENFEREYLRIQIRRFSGNISKTASFIGMERSALHRKLKLLGMGDRREDDADSEERSLGSFHRKPCPGASIHHYESGADNRLRCRGRPDCGPQRRPPKTGARTMTRTNAHSARPAPRSEPSEPRASAAADPCKAKGNLQDQFLNLLRKNKIRR
jgi:hypothetical protein